MKILKWFGVTVTGLFFAFGILIYTTTFHPGQIQDETFTSVPTAPVLKPHQKIKILSWNIQYLAGKNYVFFYDVPKGDGPDERPSAKDIGITLGEIKRVIDAEKPDIILFQEVDEGSKRTDYQNQVKMLVDVLPGEYSSYSSTFYHKALFVPHSRIMGSVGLKLATFSKYKINKAIRHQLPVIPDNILVKQFNFKRCVLEIRIPVEGQNDMAIFNTHQDAFAQGSDTMQKQVDYVRMLLEQRTKEGFSWVMGGDFNLLPPGKLYSLLNKVQQGYFNEKTELASMFSEFKSVPGLNEINGMDYKKWLTHYPNDPTVKGPDRTIDYIFLSDKIELKDHYIRQKDTLKISDHMPVVAEIIIPKENNKK